MTILQFLHQVEDRMACMDFVVPICAYEKHATAHRVREERVNQVKCSVISPLQVVQKQLQPSKERKGVNFFPSTTNKKAKEII